MNHTTLVPASLAVLLALAVAAGEPPPLAYGQGRELCRLATAAVTESSGVAGSRRPAGKAGAVFWTHNDSGDRARLFAFDERGADLGTLVLDGVEAVDCEDLAAAVIDGQPVLVLADVGDNNARRASVVLYIVDEPPLEPRHAGQEIHQRPRLRLEFRYLDGPHNCEALAVDGAAKVAYLVSKENGGACRVYRVPLKAGPRVIAQPVAVLAVPTVTAADLSPDGRRLIVLTYGDAYEYRRADDETWEKALGRPPRRLAMPGRPQGEAICYGADGQTLYLTSETQLTGQRCPLLVVPVAPAAPAPPPAPAAGGKQ